MNHIDVMTTIPEGMCQPIQLYAVAPEAVRRIEGGEMKEVERPGHREPTCRITSINWRAAASQVSLREAARPLSLI